MAIRDLTEKAREAIEAAGLLASEKHSSQVETEHLLYALAVQAEGVIPQILTQLGVTPELIKQQVESEIERQPKVYGSSEPVASNRLQNVMNSAKREAVQLKDEFISTEHLLLVIKAR